MLNVFVAVGETGGFAAAAQRLRLSPAAITRSIACLEAMLGVELLQRTTRKVRLTEAGQRYLYDIRHIIAELDDANDAINGRPKGRLVVVAPESFGKFFVMPCIVGYLRRFPDVELVASFPEQVDALLQEGVHVALAIGALRDPAVISTPVGQVRHVLCAAPAYLDRHGIPQHPVDLLQHAVIGAADTPQPMAWIFNSAADGIVMRLLPHLTVTSSEAVLDACALGLGIARVLSHQAAGPVAEGRLRLVLEGFSEAERPLYVLRQERYRDVPKVSQFARMLVDQLGRDAALRQQRA